MSHRFARFIIVSVLLGIVAPLCPAAEQAAASAITFALKKPGKVTLNIYDSRGRLVRELFGGQPLEAGEHAIPWDGLDYMNRPLDPASYSWKAIVHDGVKAEWMAAVGNSGTPPYQTADNTGSWGGDHGGACAVAADDSGFYFLWADAEAGMSALKLDRNDRTVWRH